MFYSVQPGRSWRRLGRREPQAVTATFTLGDFSFDIVALGLTIPVSCTFDSTPPAVSSVVSPS